MARRKKLIAADDGDDQDWIFTYADMMTLVLGFFILMFSLSTMDEEKFNAVSETLAKSFKGDVRKTDKSVVLDEDEKKVIAFDMLVASMGMGQGSAQIAEDVTKALVASKKLDLAKSIFATGKGKEKVKALAADIKDDAKTLSIILPTTTLFRSGGSELKKESRRKLRQVGQKLSKLNGLVEVEVLGHTDSSRATRQAKYRDNFTLSSLRAGAVARALLGGGVAKKSLKVGGMGSLRPLVPERDRSGKVIPGSQSRNRRVEIVLHVKES